MSNRDTLDNPSSYRLGGNFLRCPVTHRNATVLGLLTCQSNNLNHLFRGELRFDTRAIHIRKGPDGKRFQLSICGPLRFSLLETVLDSKPPPSPPTDALRIHTQSGRLVQIEPTLGRTQDDPNTFSQPLRRLVSTDHRSEDSPHSL
jgi:hypothetical protein